jgi:hypothetical protein
MKNQITKLVCLLLIVFIGHNNIFAQSDKSVKLLKELEGKYKLDDNNNITISKVIDLPDLNKDEIYKRSLTYFTYNYVNGESVIQIDKKEDGLIVGKGIYINAHVGVSLVTTKIDTWHILRVDIKDNKVRVMLTLTEYRQTIYGGNTGPSTIHTPIATQYPINDKGLFKTVMSKAFYNSFKLAENTIDRFEKSLKEGNVDKKIENDNNW